MTQDFWNERYAAEEFAYGTQPNAFLAHVLPTLSPGRILFPAEGEGRNAVYAAKLGWTVDACDQSSAGREKALQLAAAEQVSISYEITDLANFQCEAAQYDAVALIFSHLPADLRRKFHRQVVDILRPGGTLIAEFFRPEQLGRPSGGPKDPAMLCTRAALLEEFAGLELQISEGIVHLNEGLYHQGEAAVIRAIGRKK